jgi:hypothetical protein
MHQTKTSNKIEQKEAKMTKLREIFVSTAYLETHPGWWFRDIYSSLDKQEKIAWLELLPLAIAPPPTGGGAMFYSLEQLACFLNVDERSLTNVLKKGITHLLIHFAKTTLIPAYGLKQPGFCHIDKERIPPEALRKIDVDGNVARLYFMFFNGFDREQINPLSQKLKASRATLIGRGEVNEHMLNLDLKEPLLLLEERLSDQKPGHSILEMGEGPYGHRSPINLPVTTLYLLGAPEEIRCRLAEPSEGFFDLTHSGRPGIKDELASARKQMRGDFSEYLAKSLSTDIVPE